MHSTLDAETRDARGNRYGPTSARIHEKRPRPQAQTIDVHSHVAVADAFKLVAGQVDMNDIPMFRHSNAATRELNKRQDEDRARAMVDMDDRIAVLDAMELDRQVVAPPPPQCFSTLPADVAAKAIAVVNDGIAEFVGRRPDRFDGLGTVTFQDPDRAAEDLEGVMRRGLKGVMILTSVPGTDEIAAPRFEPFWKKAEELGAVVMIHPNGFSGGERFADYYFSNVIGNPLDTTVALHYLIFNGIMERMPNLKILAVHGGGYLPSYAGRIDHAWGARDDVNAGLPQPPTTYLKKMYFDSVVFTPHQLEYLVKEYGADHIMMGTDYPYDMADYDPVGHVVGADLTEAQKAAIVSGTAKTLFGI